LKNNNKSDTEKESTDKRFEEDDDKFINFLVFIIIPVIFGGLVVAFSKATGFF
jgi:hypothetical protein